jgi:ribonuclease D
MLNLIKVNKLLIGVKKKLTKQQIKYAINDIEYLMEMKNNFEIKLKNQKRLKTYNNIMNFLETRVDLDLMGWESSDIFAHK